jgi:hypothetical protein
VPHIVFFISEEWSLIDHLSPQLMARQPLGKFLYAISQIADLFDANGFPHGLAKLSLL